jgi:hypothetical protein
MSRGLVNITGVLGLAVSSNLVRTIALPGARNSSSLSFGSTLLIFEEPSPKSLE